MALSALRTAHAFAALRGDGRVVSWGEAKAGGNSFKVRDELKDITETWAQNSSSLQRAFLFPFQALFEVKSPQVWCRFFNADGHREGGAKL